MQATTAAALAALPTHAPARERLLQAMARAIAPRRRQSVSEWADEHRRLSAKGSAEPGRWRTARNPVLREPMDCMSSRSAVREVVMVFPIQQGKTEVAVNVLGYCMSQDPGPVMVCLPSEVGRDKWVAQKLTPMIDETPIVREALVSVASRDSANTRTFKDFAGGQLYLEHAGSPGRLKTTSVRTLIVDELDEFAANLGEDDPIAMLEGRTSAFPALYKRLYITSPQIKGISRSWTMWEASDQRTLHIACPHCGEEQPLEWSGLHWSQQVNPEHGREVWYACRECGSVIHEHEKTALISAGCNAGRWIPARPGVKRRGYRCNGLYYALGLGPRWADLVEEFLRAQNDPARLKTFLNDRLAEWWEDPAMRNVKHDIVAERAAAYPLRHAPAGVLAVTAGVDTQDNRLAVQIVGWGRRLRSWVLDYVELPGDPAEEDVWASLTELLSQPIEHASGALLPVLATAIDAGGHRTEAVKSYVRSKRIRRPLCIFGAVPNNAPVLGKGKPADVNWRGRTDKHGVTIYQVGTVAVKHWLFSRLGADAETLTKHRTALAAHDAAGGDGPDAPAPEMLCTFSAQLPKEYFPGLISETFNPTKNRFDKQRGARNEPLDTYVYAHAATHHPELRLHRATDADWDRRERELLASAPARAGIVLAPGAVPAGPPLPGALPGAAPVAPQAWRSPAAAAAAAAAAQQSPGVWHNHRAARAGRR